MNTHQRPPDWNRIRAFLATAEEGSLSAAARTLGLTQPTLGRQVAALEEELGILLFERIGRSLVLTRAEVTTFPVQVTHYFGGQSNFWAKIAAMSALGTIPIFIAVTLLQRYLVRGISLGAVKG